MSEIHKRRNGSSTELLRDSHLTESGDRDPVEELAAEFADRVRDGERVSIESYAMMHPLLADEIRDLFPMIETMEQINAKRLMQSPVPVSMPKQLGDYRIIGEIARGGMGIVYEAEQVSLGRRVAVKILPTNALRRQRDIKRFEREAKTAGQLHHSNIVPVFGVGEENGQRYIVMQLIRGVGLDEVLREVRSFVVDGRLREKSVTSERLSTAVRSAASLLDSQLGLNATSVAANEANEANEANAETVETPIEETTFQPKTFSPLSLRNPIGADYFKNVANVGLQAAEALQYAHENNTLHRDIKPGNLLLDDSGRVWIADFGLAKALQDDEVTCSGDVVGTLAYVAPERFQGTTTKTSDIYSLGITLHEMLTLQKAFDGEDRVAIMSQVANQGLPCPRKLNKAVPRDLETIVMKAASRDPNDRYQSAGDLADDLEAFIEDRPIAARRLSHVEHAARWCRRNRGMTALGVAVVFLLATVVGLLAFGYHQADKQRERFEVTSRLAVDALDEIYHGFASTSLSDSLTDDVDIEDAEAVQSSQMPISKDVALLLDKLLAFYDELSKQADDSDAVSVKYVAANRRVGDINRRLGQVGEARTSYQEAIDRIDELPLAFRNTPTMRIEAARAHNGLGLTFMRDRAQSHRNAVAILDQKNTTDEEKFELATSLYLLHRAEQQGNQNSHRRHKKSRNEHEPQEANLERAKQILSGFKQRQADRPHYDLLLARCLLENNSSKQSSRQINDDQAQAIEILESLIERYPENPDYQYRLGQFYQMLARTDSWNRRRQHQNAVQLADSETRLRKALSATAELEIEHPNIPEYYLLKKELHEFLGQLLDRQERLPEAISQYEQSIKMQRMLIRKTENPTMHRPWLFRLQLDYGKLLRDANRLKAAEESLVQTAEKCEEFIAAQNEETSHQSHRWGRHSSSRQREDRRILESTYNTLADVFEKQEDSKSASEMRRKADELDR